MTSLALDYSKAAPQEELLPAMNGNTVTVIKDFLAAAQAMRGSFSMLVNMLPKQAGAVETVTCELTSKFRALAGDATSQSDMIQQLINNYGTIEVGEKTISLDEFITFFGATLDETISKLLLVSKKSMSMIYGMEDAIKHLHEVETFSKNIQAITKRTHLLALNASIEAASAGAAGRGFNVVASEVKEVSKEIAHISEQMNVRTRSITQCVRSGYELLKDVATADMEGNVAAKETLEQMLAGLLANAEKSKVTMSGAVATSQNIAKTIQGMIIDLQFQDRNSQIAENSANILQSCEDMLKEIQSRAQLATAMFAEGDDTEREKRAIEAIFNVIKLGDLRHQFMEALCNQGAVYTGALQLTEKPASAGDDVDLF